MAGSLKLDTLDKHDILDSIKLHKILMFDKVPGNLAVDYPARGWTSIKTSDAGFPTPERWF